MSYLTVEEAELIIAERLQTEPWDVASYADKNRALIQASKRVDRLSYIGEKTVSTQEHAFPRGVATTVPDDILEAVVILAIAFLDGVSVDNEANNVTIVSQKISTVTTTYNRNVVPEWLSALIPSAEAWSLLRPYLRDLCQLNIVRV